MQLHDVLIRPVITEKSTMLMEEGKYTFRVPLTANLNAWVVHKVNVAITKKLSLL